MLKRTVCMAVLGLFAAPLDANAQGYPLRPITVVVPFPAGGPSDVVARIVTEEMGKILGQSMIIENIGGAGGTIGSARVAAANPDGRRSGARCREWASLPAYDVGFLNTPTLALHEAHRR